MYCSNCGKEIDDNSAICINCGVPQKRGATLYNQGAYEEKDWLVTLLLCVFAGGFGIHRFYTGHTGIGIVQLLTGGGCGIWVFIDLITIITGSYTDANGNPLIKK